MRLLLDTHVAIWAVNKPARLPRPNQALILDADNEVFASVVAIWEIAIKRLSGKDDAPPLSAQAAMMEFATAGFALLGVKASHAIALETLPLLHRDPFDRILVAQALAESMRLVTHDARLSGYSDTIIAW